MVTVNNLKLYRLYNPTTKQCYYQIADRIGEAPEAEAPVYRGQAARRLLDQANQLRKIVCESQHMPVEHYELREVLMCDIYLETNEAEAARDRAHANGTTIMYEINQTRQKLITEWGKWAFFDPFNGFGACSPDELAEKQAAQER